MVWRYALRSIIKPLFNTHSLIPPFHWATIRSRSEPTWKSGPIGNKRELNGSDCKLSSNERQRSGMVGKVGGDLWTCSKIAPDLSRSSVRSVSRSLFIVSWSYESGTQRVLSGCRTSRGQTLCKYALTTIELRCDQSLPTTRLRPKQTFPRLILAVVPLSPTHIRPDLDYYHTSNGDVLVSLPIRVH